ncbi:carboxymuconolactone decarboxylase family protein [Rhodococcus sp. 06-156-3C]|uniref:carboxymuconolactone decarboxylase family protein n=1 Tax=Nocardiaceae TaxID=85025 RepID=UPI0005230331|nr:MULTISPECIES: carboxymuconolactone decarboxylase family protein [Rhodococcus]OZD11637.1 carboxymuconolactone decarboxylase family protein [Rhodococcus sp. 06-156-4C]OZD15479.1 carboxymuconolactone decarboxylase family protein [Rhodococcus sp. 06-156-4a]OZD23645.1 carboxymuconolactone decarboxylase family protein [Rhodococcus sp. 06-156-3C]OZD27283.1 carboxymuconolactone decarboxylase family protein [Rhodococcus sp. 06-156-3b]OZD31321.1 carboxymuconolactone decarboxylase family protein [Rhod
MSASHKRPSGDQHPLARFSPGLIGFTDKVLFGEVWERTGISPKERSMITVACLVTGGNVDQLRYHLVRARDNGATRGELVEVITHLAFYAGWPKAMAAMSVAEEVLGSDES